MIMMTGAICFLMLEAYKLFNFNAVFSLSQTLRENQFQTNALSVEERAVWLRIFLPECLYMLWTITALFYPEWQITACVLFCTSFLRFLVPSNKTVVLLDSFVSMSALCYGIYLATNYVSH